MAIVPFITECCTWLQNGAYIDAIEDALNSGDIQIEDLIFVDEAGSKLGMSATMPELKAVIELRQ